MDVIVKGGEKMAVGGAYEGASRTSRELASDRPSIRSPDADILPAKRMADARSRDIVRNDGFANGALNIHRDSIVGSQFVLNARPNWRVLGLDETWAEEFQIEVESKFALYAESSENYIDAARRNSLTAQVRLAVGVGLLTGEVLATAEWLRDGQRPYSTALQMVHVDRLCNPDGMPDTDTLRGGIELNRFGAPIAAHIRMAHPGDPWATKQYTWKRVPFRKPWGRLQVIHIFEQFLPDQNRGIAEMVSVLKQMKMTARYQDIVLQNAVVNATYAATIESELPRDAALETLGGKSSGLSWAGDYMNAIAAYSEGAKNIHLDGAKIPHLFPGTKLKLQPAGTAGGVGTSFEESLMRHTAAGLGLSYEQFSRDYTKTNYSSARASMNETWKHMQSRKKIVADRYASIAFELWLEEAINMGDITSMPRNAPDFYTGLNKAAYSACTWIGASRGQIDELKETQAAVARIEAGLSTIEDEAARLGKDWREVLAQRARENKMAESLGLTIGAAATAKLTAELAAQSAPDPADQGDNQNE